MAAFGEPQELLTATARLEAQMRELPTTGNMEATVKSAIESKCPEAIQARSAVIQENITQFMTVELDGRIAERTSHFATKDAALLWMGERRPSSGMRGRSVAGASSRSRLRSERSKSPVLTRSSQ